jgi:hypothetical protein
MMNKSLRGGGRESSDKVEYGFRRMRRIVDTPERDEFRLTIVAL